MDTVEAGLGEIAPPIVAAMRSEAQQTRQQLAETTGKAIGVLEVVAQQQTELVRLRQRVAELEK